MQRKAAVKKIEFYRHGIGEEEIERVAAVLRSLFLILHGFRLIWAAGITLSAIVNQVSGTTENSSSWKIKHS